MEEVKRETENEEVSNSMKEHLQGVYTEKDWDDIHCLSPEVIWKIKQTFKKPSLIQFMSIGETIEFIQPVITVKCRNGGGKTLAFGVPAVEFAFRNKNKLTQKIKQQANSDGQTKTNKSFYCPTSIIVVSTQPLAEQISSVLNKISPEGVTNELLFSEQKVNSTGQILISTPDLLYRYLIKEKVIQLDNLEHFAVDEADNMISSFNYQLSAIISLFKGKDIIIQLVSATLSSKNLKFILDEQNNTNKSKLDYDEQVYQIELPWKLKGVTQYYFEVDESQESKFETCMSLIDRTLEYNLADPEKSSQIIVFFEKIRSIEQFEESLKERQGKNWKVTSCASKKERNNNISTFRAGGYDIMLASRVMSRGIDIRKVGLVINYELPLDYSTQKRTFEYNTYLHNIGRTGRYADQGVAVTFIDKNVSVETVKKSIEENLKSEILPYNIDAVIKELGRVMVQNKTIQDKEDE